MSATGVYCIRNIFDGKEYVGSAATGFIRRWNIHLHALRNNQHHNLHIQRAWNKLGQWAFIFDILEECPAGQCVNKEQEWIDALDPEYNICRTAGSCLGRSPTLSHRAKISVAKLGHLVSNETRAKISVANLGKPGPRHSPEGIANIRAAHIGNKHGLGNRSNLGRALPAATKAKLAVAHVGHNVSRATRLKIRISLLGHRVSSSTRRKLRMASLGHVPSLETRAKMSTSQRARWMLRKAKAT